MLKRREQFRTGSQQLIKEMNQVLIFKAIREKGPISRSQLAKELRLSPTTVTVIVDYFKETGFLEETGKGDSSGGRKPIMVKLSPNAGMAVAIDLDQNRVAVLNMQAEIMLEKKLPKLVKSNLVSALIGVVDEAIREYGLHHAPRLVGIGIAVPAIIDPHKGKVITSSNFTFNHLTLKEELQDHFKVPVLLENDANAAAYGEYLYGRAQQVQNFLYIHVGKAVGAGFFLAGSLFTGGGGGAGEFGHITVDESGPPCHCGNTGCLGKLISETALAEKWVEWGGDDSSVPSPAEMVELSNSGHEPAERVMDYAGELLGRGMVTLVHLFNPTLIILGGELALQNKRLQEQVRIQVERRNIPVFSKHVSFEESLTQLNAGIIGAGSLVLHRFFENLHIDLITSR